MDRSVVFLHAHPDDEAIFTGGTIYRLATAGWRVTVVVATQGELGAALPGEMLAVRREEETRRSAAILGVSRLELLGYHDSGMGGDAPGGFSTTDTEEVARRVAQVAQEEGAVALVTYDQTGIYGHPDHVQVHQAGIRAAELARVPVLYEATVDREYLHFVETHLVVEARAGATSGLGLAASHLGLPTVLIDTTVDVRAVLDAKRAAMAAHSSQIPETASAMRLPTENFAAVYGYEWFARHGPPGPIETL